MVAMSNPLYLNSAGHWAGIGPEKSLRLAAFTVPLGGRICRIA